MKKEKARILSGHQILARFLANAHHQLSVSCSEGFIWYGGDDCIREQNKPRSVFGRVQILYIMLTLLLE